MSCLRVSFSSRLRDSDVSAADMQPIEEGEELEPDNNNLL